MQGVKTIGLDIAKSVFRVHGVDAVNVGFPEGASRGLSVCPIAAPSIPLSASRQPQDGQNHVTL
jgi:hypothetical protein